MKLDTKCFESKRVLITRPQGQMEQWSALVKASHGIPICFPVIEIIPHLTKTQLLQQFKQQQFYDFFIFLSQNAIRFYAKTLYQLYQKLNKKPHIIAIGQATAESLISHHLPVTLIPEKSSSEGLLELELFQRKNIQDKQIALFKGVGGRTILPEILKTRAACVTSFETYSRKKISYSKTELTHYLFPLPDIILVTSGEILEILLQHFQTLAMEWQTIELYVFSERIKKTAEEKGFKFVTVINPS